MAAEQMTTYFQAASSAVRVRVVADQERGHDRGGLDGDPQHAEVAGQHGGGHGSDERLNSTPYRRPGGAAAPGGRRR